jgi:fatty acid desaturase
MKESSVSVETYDEFKKRRDPPRWWTPKIDRTVLQELMQRNDLQPILHYGGWVALVVALGYVSAALYNAGSLWCILAFFVYGTIYSMNNSHLHESLHGTAFKTKALNRIMFFITAAMEFRATTLTRWRHMHHHAWTIIKETDLEIQAPRPVKLWKVLIEFLYLGSTVSLWAILFLHSLGIVSKEAMKVVPRSEYQKMFWSSRACLALHLVPIVVAIAAQSWLPILLFTLPRLYGGFLIWALILAQHSGLAEDVLDHRLNTRTMRLNPVLSFLYLHMEYHTEHHMFPNIPFHALAKFRRHVEDQMPRAYSGLLETYKEEIPVLWKQRHNAQYFIHREMPG